MYASLHMKMHSYVCMYECVCVCLRERVSVFWAIELMTQRSHRNQTSRSAQQWWCWRTPCACGWPSWWVATCLRVWYGPLWWSYHSLTMFNDWSMNGHFMNASESLVLTIHWTIHLFHSWCFSHSPHLMVEHHLQPLCQPFLWYPTLGTGSVRPAAGVSNHQT